MTDERRAEERRIAAVEDVPADDTVLFTYRADGERREAVLVRRGDAVFAWRNRCQHWTDVRLDTGDGAPVRGDEIRCRRHGATFEADSGRCTFGPCEGAELDPVEVTVEGGDVVLEAGEFVRLGAAEDVGGDVGPQSTSPGERLGF